MIVPHHSNQKKRKPSKWRNTTWLSVSLNHRSCALYQQSCDSGFLGNKIVLLISFPNSVHQHSAMWAHATARQTSVLGHCFHTVFLTLILQDGFLFLLGCWYYTIYSYSFHWRDSSSYSSQRVFGLDKFSRKAGCGQWKVITVLCHLYLDSTFLLFIVALFITAKKIEITHMTTNWWGRQSEFTGENRLQINVCQSENKSVRHVQLFATMDCSPQASSIHGILHARILE